MKIYSYCRTSTREYLDIERDQKLSLETELLAIQTYCLQRDWYLSESFQDNETDWGVNFKGRENGARLISLLSAGDKVICSHLDRVVSSSKEAAELVEFFRSLNVQFHVVGLNGDLTSEGFSIEFAKAAQLFSRLDKKKSAERIKSVKQKQRNKGRYLGGSRPFGYMVHENGKLIENPLEQRLLRKILELKRAGKSLRSISETVSTPLAPVSFKTVQRLLQRHADQL